MRFLSPQARATIEAHFGRNAAEPPRGNEPVYRLTRETKTGRESVDVPEHLMPEGLTAVVKDELA